MRENVHRVSKSQGKNGTAVVVDAKSANAPFLSRLSQKMASSKKYQLSLSVKHLQAQPFLKRVKNLVHTKPELVIEPEEMDLNA